MGSAILDGVLSKNIIKKESLFIVEPDILQKKHLEGKGIKVFNSLSEINFTKLKINIVLLAVKPQLAKEVLTNLKKIMINNIFILTFNNCPNYHSANSPHSINTNIYCHLLLS